MPSQHERKEFVPGGIYHVFNRGINKMEIFHNVDDYAYFERSLIMYLSHPDELYASLQHSTKSISTKHLSTLVLRASKQKNYADEIRLRAFCLMPNHFHLLIQQDREDSLSRFMKSLQTSFAMYYGKKYKRIGPLFQGRYKGILVKNDAYYTTVINYIHENPAELRYGTQDPQKYPWSSLRDYLEVQKRAWILTGTNLDRFRSS